MSQRCAFRQENGKFCRRWPVRGTRYCLGHTPPPPPHETEGTENLSPLDRLNSHDDLFDVVRETLHAIRLGRISPGRAYATGYFVDLWMRVRERMEKAGAETTKFHKRRIMSNPVEQAMFDVVAEKVVEMMTGRSVEEIERNAGHANAPGEPHFTERSLGPQHPLAAPFFPDESPWLKPPSAPAPAAPSSDPALPAAPASAPPAPSPAERSETIPLPKNWGYEDKQS
jgi:hypothetical protein